MGHLSSLGKTMVHGNPSSMQLFKSCAKTNFDATFQTFLIGKIVMLFLPKDLDLYLHTDYKVD